ncbi:PREDICTED: protamine-like [Rhagoletis zephyria]|uniref:protamine-like n=1 Tax=Rhagoletis zephyria TaxID=28612 RepID=UPI00081178CB|nr:PREDICTED: protamine-like [Rhagoletis zephyria]
MEVEKKLSLRSTSKTNCVSKTAFNQTKAGKCQRPRGPLHRNPYLNFLREFRQRNCGLSAVEIIRRGAKEWNNMAKESKLRYIEEAFYAPKKRKLPQPPPHKQQPTQMRVVSYAKDCGPVCPRANAGCKKRRKRRMAKCGRKRRPKMSCAMKRRPRRRACRRKKRRSCRV